MDPAQSGVDKALSKLFSFVLMGFAGFFVYYAWQFRSLSAHTFVRFLILLPMLMFFIHRFYGGVAIRRLFAKLMSFWIP